MEESKEPTTSKENEEVEGHGYVDRPHRTIATPTSRRQTSRLTALSTSPWTCARWTCRERAF